MREVWKDVRGFEGEYKISNKGRLKHYSKRFGWNVLKNTNKNGWYFNVTLRHGKSFARSVKIHRLVAEAFIPNPNNLKCVNHIDMNKQNNCVDNLEWCSHKENTKKAIEQKPDIILNMVNYNKFVRPRHICQYSINGNFICEYRSAQEASNKTGVCVRNILQVANNTPYNSKGSIRKQAGGFVWRLCDKGGD